MTDNNLKKYNRLQKLSSIETIYNENYLCIYRYCCKRLFCRTAAEDVTASVFLSVTKNMHTFNGQTDQQLKNWLYKIASNQANEYLRKKKRREKILQEVFKITQQPKNNDHNNDNSNSEWAKLYQAISKLKTSDQTLLTLRFFESLDYAQIAQILKKRPAALRIRCHRALKKLRKLMQGCSLEI